MSGFAVKLETAFLVKMGVRRQGQSAFTMIELLVIAVFIAILAAFIMPKLSIAKEKARRITCVSHLKCVGLAHRIFANDNDELFVWEKSLANETNRANFPDLSRLSAEDQVLRIYGTLSNELSTPRILACPADVRKPVDDWPRLTTNNVSYFVGLSAQDAKPQTFLAGDRNLVLLGRPLTGRAELKRDALLEWDQNMHRSCGNVSMGDGSVQQFTSARLKQALANSGVETNIFLIP